MIFACSSSPQKPKSKNSFTPLNTLTNQTRQQHPPCSTSLNDSSFGNSTSLFDSPPMSTTKMTDGDVNGRIAPSVPSQTIDVDQENLREKRLQPSFGENGTGISLKGQKAQQSEAQSGNPEFGKPSPLRSKLMSIFNIPKKGVARPEHHRSGQNDNASSRAISASSNELPEEFYIAPPPPRFDGRGDQLRQQYVQVPGAPPVFSSLGSSSFKPINIAPSHPRGVIDLTSQRDSDDEFDPDAALRDKSFGAPDPFQYMDPTQANENLKQLLEGAFDEEEEGEHNENNPKKRRKLPKTSKKVADTTAKAIDGAKSLAEKLKMLEVNDKKDPEHKKEEKKIEDGEDEDEDEGIVDGLNVKLLPHQIDGVSWMIERESGKKKRGVLPKGGILADDMGLGKTIQAISLILTNPRPALEVLEKDKKKKKIPLDTSTSTLVVAPLALIRQWESEIKTKAPSLKVLVHHGQSRTTSSTKLASHDIVITTYQTLMSEHVGGNSINGCFAVKWYRVILDEAHSIKNPKAKSTQACYDLSSIYRWCLTGTPLQNNLDELQSLIRFLRIKPYCDLQCWKRDITGPIKDGRGGIGLRRLHYFLRASMKRRTKDVLKKDGALGHNSESQSGQNFKIVGREVKAIVAEFDYNERKFYERLESRAQESLAEMMKRGNNDYIGALVLLLRLRQACNHPYLMKSKMEKDRDALATGSTNGSRAQQSQKAEDDEVDGLTNLLGGLSVQTKKCDVCKAKMSIEEVNKGAERCAACDADLEENLSQERRDRKKGKSKKPKKNIKENARLRKERRRRVIVDSDDEDKAEWIDPNHKPTEIAGELNTDDEDAEGGGDWIGDEDSQTSDEEQDKHSSSDEEEPEQEVNYNFYKPVRFNADAITNDLPPSTKIKQLLNILKEETPEHKVIVFSQFTSMLDIIEPFLEKKGYRFVRYDGSMRNDQREESLNLLRNNKKTRVLLCSLKCGSLGLNLTAASRVVIMEPFWNPFVEEQAIDRVHRLNQTRDVVVYKLTIADTVEERILGLQEVKRSLAKAALEGGKSAAKLNMADILALFRHDNHGPDVIDSTPTLGGMSNMLSGNSRSSQPPSDGDIRRPKPGTSGQRREEHPLYGRRW